MKVLEYLEGCGVSSSVVLDESLETKTGFVGTPKGKKLLST